MRIDRSIQLRLRRLLPTAFAVVILLLGITTEVGAAEACVGRTGGITLLDPGDEDSGVGGTGVTPPSSTPQARRGDEDDSGLGGTGRAPSPTGDDEDSGIGGTGLFGTITAVHPPSEPTGAAKPASRSTRICLNGLAIDVPESLALESSGGGAAARVLAVGQLVYVAAHPSSDGLVAERFVLSRDYSGQIESARIEAASDDGTILFVSGRRVRLAADVVNALAEPRAGAQLASRTGLEAGRWIRIQGQLAPDGLLVATRIEPGRAGEIQMSAGDRASDWLAPRADGSPRFDYVSFEGFVARAGDRPRVGGIEIALPARDGRGPGVAGPLAAGARVRIGGRPRADGRIVPAPAPRIADRPTTSRPKPSSPPDGGAPPSVDPSPGDAPAPKPDLPPEIRPHAPRRIDPPRPTLPPRIRDARPAVRQSDVRPVR